MKKLPPFKLIPEPLSDEARQIPTEEIGDRFQLGGEPDIIQGKMNPLCSSCSQPMTFYAQLDSIGIENDIADSGLIYVFLCYDCFDAQAFVDSY